MREGPLLGGGHLRVDPRLRGTLVEAVARAESRELHGGLAVHDHQPIEAQVCAGLDEERRIGHQHGARRLCRRPAPLQLAHARVHDRVEPHARLGVGEHQRGESGTVERAILQHRIAEGRHDLDERLAARRRRVACGLVEVERPAAACREPPEHLRLSGRDAAGEADAEQGSPQGAFSAARTVFAISIAIVRGPTPPGTGVSAPATADTSLACTSPTSA